MQSAHGICLVIQAKDAKVFMVVRALDTHTHQWSVINPNGALPPQRGGHSVSPSCNRLCSRSPAAVWELYLYTYAYPFACTLYAWTFSACTLCLCTLCACRIAWLACFCLLAGWPAAFLFACWIPHHTCTCNRHKAHNNKSVAAGTLTHYKGDHDSPQCIGDLPRRALLWVIRFTCLVVKMLHEGLKAICLCWTSLTWSGNPQRSQVLTSPHCQLSCLTALQQHLRRECRIFCLVSWKGQKCKRYKVKVGA